MKLSEYVLIGLLSLGLGVAVVFAIRGQGNTPAAEEFLKEENTRLLAEVDSLRDRRNTLIVVEKDIIVKYRNKNEKEIVYILGAADSVQPSIRAKQIARAIELLSAD